MNKYAAEKRLNEKRAELEMVNAAYERALLSQSWETKDGNSSRQVTNANVTSLYNQKLSLEKKIERLEAIVEGLNNQATRVGPRL